MTKYIKIASFIIVSMVFLSSCINNEFKEPEKEVYNPGFDVTTTISDLIDIYGDSLTFLDTNIVIAGTVIANDKSGNYYKSIVIQDSTAGIEISINGYELHNMYHIGDLVYVKCEGLYLGEYGGVVQLGSIYEGGIGRIEEPMIEDHIFKSEGGMAIVPKPVTINTLSPFDVNKLIILHDVQFGLNALGNTYGNAEYQIDRDVPVENCDGNSVIVRTSGYADFARDTISSGNGSLIAVLGVYNGEFQLKLRTPDEVNFNNSRCGDVFYYSFVDEGIDDFTAFSVTGSQTWYYDADYGAVMNGFPSANEDWLISPSYDLSNFTDMVLRFRHTAGYTYPGYENDLKVFICDDYDGVSNPNTSGAWTELTGFAYPTGNWSWTDSGDIDISGFNNNPNVYIAYKYESSSSDACAWEIDNMRIRVN